MVLGSAKKAVENYSIKSLVHVLICQFRVIVIENFIFNKPNAIFCIATLKMCTYYF